MSELAGFRLPSGRHGLPKDLVAESRRWRLLSASAKLFAEAGPAALSSASIAGRAGVSKTAFYDEFENVGDCLATASRMARALVVERLAESGDEATRGEARLRRVVGELLRVAASEPELMALLSPAAAATAPALGAVREELIEAVTELLGGEPTSRASAAALLALCQAARSGTGPPEDLQPELVRLLRWTSP